MLKADVSCAELIELAAKSAEHRGGRRNTATSIMAEGLRLKVLSLHNSGELQGIIAITG